MRISKGYQVAVPSETRERYDLGPGDEIVWIDTGKEILLGH
ncbi:MAG: AbrB/MazE/SpoVT family DNA-binding domain-containing protein [Candidatus Jordarchaeaceae archaeon]